MDENVFRWVSSTAQSVAEGRADADAVAGVGAGADADALPSVPAPVLGPSMQMCALSPIQKISRQHEVTPRFGGMFRRDWVVCGGRTNGLLERAVLDWD